MVKIEKRDGKEASFNPLKIYNRIKVAAKGLKVNSEEIFAKVIISAPTEGTIKTRELDKLTAEIAASYTGSHHDYSKLASYITVSAHQKNTDSSFFSTMSNLASDGIISEELIKTIELYGIDKVEEYIDYKRDFIFDYFGWKSMQDVYLLKDSNGRIVERPQHMYMRVAIWLTKDWKSAKDYYDQLSNHLISLATPIMINGGSTNPQLSSCVLAHNSGDSREGLLDTLRDISVYSSDAAGIGLCMSNIRSKESRIKTSGGFAGGLLKYLKIVNESLRFFNQQGRRPGSAAIYIEPWHKDIFDLLDIKKNTGADELRARDIFTALWIPDNFMRAVESNEDWYLFCPNDIIKAGLKPLSEIYGEEYEEEYAKAIELGLGKKVKAQEIWTKIIESQIETGVPYLASKDNANKKTNHQNIGTIRQSNLCCEIFQYSDPSTTAICTLSSMILKNYVNEDKQFDFKLLHSNVRKVVRTLNKVIDINKYSTKRGEKGGKEQRAIGIGVQGLADTFFLMDYAFTSEEAKLLNKQIFETIYHAAVTESCELCKTGEYKPYDFFKGSPMSKGIFQFDMWGYTEENLSGMWNWKTLKEDVVLYGLANSLMTCCMPTAGSARATNSYEMTEPAHSALFNRRVVGGEIMVVNKYLIDDLEEIGIWSEELKNEIIVNGGSIEKISFDKYLNFDDKKYEKKVNRLTHLKNKYQTIWEIPQKELINMTADRGPFIDQSQSTNLYFKNPTPSKLTSATFYGWKKGLKTLNYYIRTQAISTGAKHLAIDMERNKLFKEVIQEKPSQPEIIPSKPEDSSFVCAGGGCEG